MSLEATNQKFAEANFLQNSHPRYVTKTKRAMLGANLFESLGLVFAEKSEEYVDNTQI